MKVLRDRCPKVTCSTLVRLGRVLQDEGCVIKYDIDVTVLQTAIFTPLRSLLDLRRRLDALQIFKSYCATMRLPPVLGVYGTHNTLHCL
jgi:hypothetical protein